MKYLSEEMPQSFCPHEWGKWKVEREATCTRTGYRYRLCKICGIRDEQETKNVKVSDLWIEFMRNRPLRVIALFFITAFAMMSVGNAAGAYFMNNMETLPALAQEGIRWLVCVIPAILLVLAMLIISKYELSDEYIDEINKAIEERNHQ